MNQQASSPAINRCGLSYTDKVAIITGGSKGIGEGCARVFVDAGAKVVICARDRGTGEALAEELSARGPGSCHFELCDVRDTDEIDRLIRRTMELHGQLDCLVNNAGYHPPHQAIDAFSFQDLQDLMQLNFVNYFACCKYALPHLRKSKGTIVNMGSLVGQIGQEGATTYCATKGAIGAFTKALAIDEAHHGVRVNAILPGNILSDNRKKASAARPDAVEFDKWIDSHQPCGRSGTIEEVGQLCLFLATECSSYLTGTEIIISGGSELGYGVKFPLKMLS